ncbi:LmrA/YxaF family transcription factor [Streptomyces nymphaeiformis]|uniref:Transcriptional regulator LmrA/YxaF-like C-terminal domain-containing protein n=1 Tax=Streptomyces nymphaeiformis TaxID=2663842 RepID=A0A7W7TX99_9ACTN|nr:hypothetical protein [Streptomyces nymphaeiformis]MBB4981021.1 hypothetical protein [Streptomyces nymphaeiformis]
MVQAPATALRFSTWEAWEQWRQTVLDHYTELGQRCPLSSLTTELGNSSLEARGIITTLFDEWEEALLRGVRVVTPQKPQAAHSRARSILAAVQGGVVILQATGRTDYLDAALTTALDDLRPYPPRSGTSHKYGGCRARAGPLRPGRRAGGPGSWRP